MKKSLPVFLIIGMILIGLGNVGSIGYGLYLWGGTGMTLGLAAWTAFKVWLIIIGTGLLSLIVGLGII